MADPIDTAGELDVDEHAATGDEAEQDLRRWLGRKQWTRDEAVHLLNGLDPDESGYTEREGHNFAFLPHGRSAEREGCDAYTLERNVGADLMDTRGFIARDGEPRIRAPRDWLSLATDNGHEVPWLEFARGRPALRRYLPDGEGDRAETNEELRATIAGLKAEVARLSAESDGLRPLQGKAKASAMKMIAGMAVAGWRLDLRTLPTEQFRELHRDLERVGAKTSENALRKWLRDGAEYIDWPRDEGD